MPTDMMDWLKSFYRLMEKELRTGVLTGREADELFDSAYRFTSDVVSQIDKNLKKIPYPIDRDLFKNIKVDATALLKQIYDLPHPKLEERISTLKQDIHYLAASNPESSRIVWGRNIWGELQGLEDGAKRLLPWMK